MKKRNTSKKSNNTSKTSKDKTFFKKKSRSGKASGTKQASTIPVTALGLRAMVIVALLILLVGVALWWQFIFLDEQKVFERMLRHTLRTHSVTKVITEEDATQSFEQINRLQLGANPAVLNRTTVVQKAPEEARVVTEEIGTPSKDFVRYTVIETPIEADEETPVDYSEIIDVWGAVDQQPGTTDQGQLFSEVLFGILPFANVSKNDQNVLYNFLIDENVYDVDYLGTTKQTVNGRKVYSYRIALQPQAYVAYLQKLAAAQGLDQFQDVNPEDFGGVSPIQFSMDVDVYSGLPLFVETLQDQRREEFTDFGRIQEISIPEGAIPSSELQQRIQAIQ